MPVFHKKCILCKKPLTEIGDDFFNKKKKYSDWCSWCGKLQSNIPIRANHKSVISGIKDTIVNGRKVKYVSIGSRNYIPFENSITVFLVTEFALKKKMVIKF